MSIPWIKIEATLPHKPEVMRIASKLGISEFAVVGHLVAFWVWCDGNLKGQCPRFFGTVSGLDRIAGRDGFTQAMIEAEWLATDGQEFWIPNFDRHLDQSAKTRAFEAERKRRQRNSRDSVPDDAGHCPKKNRTRGEERRVDNKHTDAGASCADAASQGSAQQTSPPAPAKRKPRPLRQLCEESEAVAEFPVVGGGVWWLPGWKADEWAEVFTGVDVPSEVNKALQWLRDNPSKRKTHRGMLRFLNQWIERAQNDAGRRQAGRGQGDWQNHEQRRENSNAAAIAAVRAK